MVLTILSHGLKTDFAIERIICDGNQNKCHMSKFNRVGVLCYV
jgi:hypothetical protein